MKLFDKDISEVDWDNIEFVYVNFDPYTPVEGEEADKLWNPNFQGLFSWGAKGVGFGEIGVYQMGDPKDGRTFFETEHMSKKFLKQMLNYWVDNGITDRDSEERPASFLEYGPLDN